ncbi:hypothetical protein CLAFUW4_11761 [Fulvia fulva]|uniref:Uncharacterized protein n=1 Tax=Passalora fulva TaxID=5499 RepID=A0A9Q8USP2_PASFU|nr:uncharacterized protein CLAFUR5_10805 [Fulvia fulva]KAK4618295.1 hypothetical protein CLAFUR4_11766 [Fulvia fulva]KAK4618761.1 hypothetical protein CLAFUR0_11779 [Fulvia fulva]UJO21039.1 hypothetical protein CLAFUR5_10805 [Fulvia fulva]WPV18508.1 hypothetical protein CLAFUW4_11761 [Fulvia fulva]WPV32786.1 hypothetical protein CLAFUW7_11768 [Fulvia fulva]
MNFLTKVTALLLPLLPCALAQAITSSSFYLVIEQPGATRDNTTLYSCPTAGHYSALCPDYLNPVMNRNSTTFHLNSTSIDPASEFLTVDVVDENMDYIESKALVFAYGPTTNVATPLFTSADVKEYTKLITATTVYFDDSEHLGIRSNYDDSVDPAVLGHWVAYYKW